MISHRITLYADERLVECSRRFSTSVRPTENASRYDVGQRARALVDRRAGVRASPSAAHRLVSAHRAASATLTDRRRSPFAVPRVGSHRRARRL